MDKGEAKAEGGTPAPRGVQNVENKVVWDSSGSVVSPKVTEIAPFNTAHTSSYYPSTVTMSLSLTVIEI